MISLQIKKKIRQTWPLRGSDLLENCLHKLDRIRVCLISLPLDQLLVRQYRLGREVGGEGRSGRGRRGDGLGDGGARRRAGNYNLQKIRCRPQYGSGELLHRDNSSHSSQTTSALPIDDEWTRSHAGHQPCQHEGSWRYRDCLRSCRGGGYGGCGVSQNCLNPLHNLQCTESDEPRACRLPDFRIPTFCGEWVVCAAELVGYIKLSSKSIHTKGQCPYMGIFVKLLVIFVPVVKEHRARNLVVG